MELEQCDEKGGQVHHSLQKPAEILKCELPLLNCEIPIHDTGNFLLTADSSGRSTSKRPQAVTGLQLREISFSNIFI